MSSNKPVIGFDDNLANNYQDMAPTLYAIGKMRAGRTPYDIDGNVIKDANKLFRPGLYLLTTGTTNVVPSYTFIDGDVCYLYNIIPDPDESLKGGHVEDKSYDPPKVDIHKVLMHARQIAYLYKGGEVSVQTRIGLKDEAITGAISSTINQIKEVLTLTAVSTWSYRFCYELGYWIKYKTVGGSNIWEPAYTWSDWTAFGGSSSSSGAHNPVEFITSSITAEVNTTYISFDNNTVTLPAPANCELGDVVRVDQWINNGSVIVTNTPQETVETLPNRIQIGSTDFTWNDIVGGSIKNLVFYDNSDDTWSATRGSSVYTIKKNSGGTYTLVDGGNNVLATKSMTGTGVYPWTLDTAGRNVWTAGDGSFLVVDMERGYANNGCGTYEFEVTLDGYSVDSSKKIWMLKKQGGATTVVTYDFNEHNGVKLAYNGDKLTVSGIKAAPNQLGTVKTVQELISQAASNPDYNNTVPSVTATFNAIKLVSTTLSAVSATLTSHIENHPSGGGTIPAYVGDEMIDIVENGPDEYQVSLLWSSTITNGVALSKVDDKLVARGIAAGINMLGTVQTLNTVVNTIGDTENLYTVPTINAVSSAITTVSTSVSSLRRYTELVSETILDIANVVTPLSTDFTAVSADFTNVSNQFSAVSANLFEVSATLSDHIAHGGGGGGGLSPVLPLTTYGADGMTLSYDSTAAHSGVKMWSTGQGALYAAGTPANGTFISNGDTFGVVKTVNSIPTDGLFNSADAYTPPGGERTEITNPGEKYVVPTIVAVQNYVAAMMPEGTKGYDGPFNVAIVNDTTVSVGGAAIDNDNNTAGRMYYKADASCTMPTANLTFAGTGAHELYAYIYYNGTGYTSGYAIDNANIPDTAKGSQGAYRLIAKFSNGVVGQLQYGDIVFPARW